MDYSGFVLKFNDSNKAYASNESPETKANKSSMMDSVYFYDRTSYDFFWKLIIGLGLTFSNLPGSERVKPVSIIAKSFPFQTRLSTLCLGKHNSIWGITILPKFITKFLQIQFSALTKRKRQKMKEPCK